MKILLALIALIGVHTCSKPELRPQDSDLLGQWKIEISLGDQSTYSVRFDARESGRGSLVRESSRSNWDEPGKPAEAKWTAGPDKRVTFWGLMEFPIGNVGRESGTIVFKGTFKSERAISGEFAFFPTGEEPFDPKSTPSRTGTFKALRIASS